MTVAVDIPTRVRLDAPALHRPDADELVAEALRAAATRALSASAQEVLAGGAAEPRLVEPWFAWSGDGLADVDAARRADLEGVITGALAAAIREAGVRSPDTAAGPAVRGEPSEPLDRERYAGRLRHYLIDRYDEGGAPTAAPLKDMEGEVLEQGGALSFADELAVPDPAWTREDWINAFIVACDEARPRQGVPSHHTVGLLYARAGGGYEIRWFVVKKLDWDGVEPTDGYLRIAELWNWDVDEKGRPFFAPAALMPWGNLRLRVLGAMPTPVDRIAVKREHLSLRIRGALDAERERLGKGLSEEEFTRLKDEVIAALLEGIKEDPGVGEYIELLVRDASYLVGITDPTNWPADTLVPLVSYTQIVEKNQVPGTGGEEGRGGKRRGAGGGDKVGKAGRGRGRGEPGGREGGVEGGQAEGGFVAVPGEEGAVGGALFPTVEGGDTIACEAFLEEPPMSDLGADGERLRTVVERIASKLAVQPCEYAGGFALYAAGVFGGRAGDVGQFSVSASDAFLQPPPAEGTGGNLGAVDFRPAPSPAIQFMRHLAGIAPDLTQLVNDTCDVYQRPEHAGKITSFRNPMSWTNRFQAEINGSMKWSVATMFGMTCRVLMLQLLRASAAQLQGRLGQIDAYAALFEQALLPRLRRIDELIAMRDQLKSVALIPGAPAPAQAPEAGTPAPSTGDEARRAWQASRREVADALAGPDAGEAVAAQAGPTPARGTLTPTPGGWRIHDGRGRAWSLAELEQGIVSRRGWVESLDPLVKQLVELDDVLERFADPARGVRAELLALLTEMLMNNAEQTRNVEESWLYAFRASRINESIASATVPYTRYALGGIHLQAHEALADAFRGDPFYGIGIDGLFGSELGRLGLITFFEFAGTLFLAVVCPPLGAAVAVGLAAYHLDEAHEREQLYGSLIDPELVITRAEVEAELFMARLGFALAIIPEVGTILRSGARLGGAVARSGVRVGARQAGRALATHLAEETVRSLRRGIVLAFVREIATDQAVEAIAQRVVAPVVAQIEREAMVTGPAGGERGASRILALLAAEARKGGE